MRPGTRGSCRSFEAQAGESEFSDRWRPQEPDSKCDPAPRGEAVARWIRIGAGYGDARSRPRSGRVPRTLQELGRDGFCMGWNGGFGRVAGGYIVRMDRDACLTRYFQPWL